MKKRAIAQAKRGFNNTAVNRTISDAAVTTKTPSAIVAKKDTRLSVSQAAPGIPAFNIGGYRAFQPGPAANQDHGTPFGFGPQLQFDFWAHGLPVKKAKPK